MKIHIVQKGDTLWNISQQYGVDFEEVKRLNPQLSSPDMIMPGMKIKIPGTSKAVKNDSGKGTEMPETKHPFKDTSPMPKPVMNKGTEQEQAKMKPEIPKKPEMPEEPMMPTKPMKPMQMMDQDFYNYTTINFPEMSENPQPNNQPKQNAQMHMPPQPMPIQVVPVCCYCHQPCCPPPPMQHGPQHGHKKGGCGCGGPKPPHFRNQMESYHVPNERKMPVGPMENPYMNYNNLYGAPFASPDDRNYTDLNKENMQRDPIGPNGNMPVPEPPEFGTMAAYNFREDMNEPEE
ncbi:SafA/ExsA family spore coat assembly protein [Virgibacillus siamensis]|uniref:SafA/ExsA family spore coat assembly protein n=1 Tax=Virgibacillus siamensis TaxID=480071 RepID=UPI0031CF4050